ncbi:MAG: erythromycin esterase family protein [Oligoflexus sp.]
MARKIRHSVSEPPGSQELIHFNRDLAQALQTSDDLTPLLDKVEDARYVLLGETSHGTSEYYSWRADLSKRLILEKGFSFIAVEGDWPDCYRINRYVKGYPNAGRNAHEVLKTFARWPTYILRTRSYQFTHAYTCEFRRF